MQYINHKAATIAEKVAEESIPYSDLYLEDLLVIIKPFTNISIAREGHWKFEGDFPLIKALLS